MAREYEPHVVVLDVMMPGMDGFDVCKMLKKESGNIAVIMLTAKDEVDDRVKGLTLGADDYLIKPFSFDELLARIGARLRNQFPSLTGETWGLFRIDDRRKEIMYQEQVLELSPTEYELLKYLVINHGIVLSKTKILDKVWGYDFGGEENIVEVYIRSLREKLGDKDQGNSDTEGFRLPGRFIMKQNRFEWAKRLIAPRSLRFQLLSRSLFILTGLLLLIGLLQYILMKDFLYRNQAATITIQTRGLPRDLLERSGLLPDLPHQDRNSSGIQAERDVAYSSVTLTNAANSVLMLSLSKTKLA